MFTVNPSDNRFKLSSKQENKRYCNIHNLYTKIFNKIYFLLKIKIREE